MITPPTSLVRVAEYLPGAANSPAGSGLEPEDEEVDFSGSASGAGWRRFQATRFIPCSTGPLTRLTVLPSESLTMIQILGSDSAISSATASHPGKGMSSSASILASSPAWRIFSFDFNPSLKW